MLKKHNKLIMLLVLVTFMFTMVGSAGAATFSDVTGTSAESAAIYKLNGLGIIDGYQDGTFGPEKNITRAEFAKIACVTAGLKSVASGMGATASPFSDVAADHWANGWINVAAAQGYVKGDPAGTFRPEDQITQAEVVTVLLRLLGYNDNLAGEWPSDYIAKAASLDVLDDVTFVANQAATRGVVAILTSATLDENVVEYKASDNIFDNKLDKNNDPYTLLFDKFDDADKVEDAFVYSVDVGNDEFTLKYYEYDEKADDWSMDSTGKTVTLTDDAVISGGKSALDAQMRYVDFIKNDDGDATYVEIKNYGVIKTTEIETKELKINGGNIHNGDSLCQTVEDSDTNIEYDFAPDVIWRPASTGYGPTLQAKAQSNDAADYYEFTLNEDGDVAGVNVSTMPAPGLVDYANNDRETISFKTNPVECLTALGTNYTTKAANLKDKTYFVNKNGMPGKLSDIQEGDVVWILNGQDNYEEAGYNGVDYYIVAVSRALLSVTGTLESVEDRDNGMLKKVTVDGKTYEVVDSMNYDNPTVMYAANSTTYAAYKDGRTLLQDGTLYATHGAADPFNAYDGKPAGFIQNDTTSMVVPFLSTDGGDDFEFLPGATTASSEGGAEYISGGNYDLTGKTVELVMTPNGKVGGIVCDVDKADSGRIFGVIIEEVPGTTSGGELVDAIKIVNAADDEATYFIDDDSTLDGDEEDDLGHAIIDDVKVAPGKLVSFTLQSNGNIDNIKTSDIDTGDITSVDDDLDTAKIGSSWYAGKDVVFWAYDPGAEDATVKKWSDLEDNYNAAPKGKTSYYIDSNELMYVMMSDVSLSGDSHYAVYKSRGKDADDYFVNAIIDGEVTKYILSGSADYDRALQLQKGNVFEFNWDGGDLEIKGKAQPSQTDSMEITKLKLSNNIVEMDDEAYLVDEDTVVFDCSDDDNLIKLTLDDLALGDQVYVILDNSEADPLNEPLMAIVVTDDDEYVKQLATTSKANANWTPSVKALNKNASANETIAAAGGSETITFSEELNATSQAAVIAAVKKAVTGVAGTDLAVSFNDAGTILTITNNHATLDASFGNVICAITGVKNEQTNTVTFIVK